MGPTATNRGQNLKLQFPHFWISNLTTGYVKTGNWSTTSKQLVLVYEKRESTEIKFVALELILLAWLKMAKRKMMDDKKTMDQTVIELEWVKPS